MLINGAGGGSGSFAIQLAKRLGAHVTGVDNAAKLDFMRSSGADEVIDYRRDDFTRTTEPYDLILDLVAHRSVFAYRRALAPGGTVPVRGWVGAGAAARAHRSAAVVGTAHRSLDRGARREAGSGPLRAACRRCASPGEVSIHIDRTFTLDEVPAALAHVGEGRALGKVVVTSP